MSHKAFSQRVLRIVATLAATGLVAACGYKGPLYMPPGSSGEKNPDAQKIDNENRPRIPPNPSLP